MDKIVRSKISEIRLKFSGKQMFYSKGDLLSAYFLNIFSNIIYDQFSQNCPGPDSSVLIKSMTEVNLSISNTFDVQLPTTNSTV